MNKKNKLGYVIAGFMALTALLSLLVWADASVPYGVRDITYIQSSRSNTSAYPPATMEAMAGNVTELTMNTISTTRTWQGYFGNVSGVITLEDANGNVFYNWTAAEAQGEIFASVNDSVAWASIVCFNWTGQAIDLSTEEARYGLAANTPDGIDETYANAGLDSDIFIGNINVTAQSANDNVTCHTTNPFQYGSQNSNTDNFENFLLTDGSGALVFATVLENDDFNHVSDIIGYDNQPHDFQMLVAENGHNSFEDTTTTYYFWAEVE